MHTYMIESLMISFLTSFNVFQRVSTCFNLHPRWWPGAHYNGTCWRGLDREGWDRLQTILGCQRKMVISRLPVLQSCQSLWNV